MVQTPSTAEQPSLTLIIPVGPGDSSWQGLLPFLSGLDSATELIFVGCEPAPAEWPPAQCPSARWEASERGRAKQCNAGVARSSGQFLWWLHADSRPQAGCWTALQTAIVARPDALHWFRLGFADGPALTWLNAAGANWRSRRLGLPFGDQGLCLSRAQHRRLGGFDESLALAEDLALVVGAKRMGVALNEVQATIVTSARRYRDRGWLRTTLRHLWLTWRLVREHSQ